MRWVWGVLILMVLGGCGRAPRAGGEMPQDVYVWQRDWTTNVVATLADRGGRFRRVVVLGAEVSWVSGQPRVVEVPFRLDAARVGSVGVAMRVGPYAGPYGAGDAVMRGLVATARSMVGRARSQGVEPAEVQLDFDCAESRLEGYRVWVEVLRRELRPVPLVVTALPSWLKRRSFATLARAADGFVLQVHSLARPKRMSDAFELCDPVQALRSVEVAGRVGVPFRVALPSYGYLVAFGPGGEFVGASAEGGSPERPAGSRWRELWADPGAMARLVRTWGGDRPPSLEGLIWYRMPMPGDRLNWRWPTLEAVMGGRTPEARLDLGASTVRSGLVELELSNRGTGDWAEAVRVKAEWTGTRALAVDALRGFEAGSSVDGGMLFTNAICRLRAGERMLIGWVRFEGEVPADFRVSLVNGPLP